MHATNNKTGSNIISENCVGVDPPSISASRLKEERNFLSHFGFPLGYDGYIPNERLRNLCMNISKQTDENDILFYANSILQFSNGEVDYSITPKSETILVRPMLERIMDLLVWDSSVCVKSGESLPGRENFVLAKGTSLPEPCIVYNNYISETKTSQSFIIIGSEVKGSETSLVSAFPQGLQITGDGCIALRRAGMELSDCVVPGLLIAGDHIQFVGSYLLPPAYPCFITLSRSFCLISYSDIRDIGKWIISLQKFALDT